MYVFIGLHCLLPEAATRVEMFCKKSALKNLINFIGKHLCWSLFLIKLQAWHLFWRTSANDCFCTALAPLTVTYPFYFYSARSSSSLLILLMSPTFVFGSNSKGFKELKSGISLSLKSLSSVLFYFSMFFLSFSVLFHFFLSLLIKTIVLT